jgi:hypothetical protein
VSKRLTVNGEWVTTHTLQRWACANSNGMEMAMFPFYFNPLYLLFALPGLLLGLYAQARVRSAFAQYERVRSARGMTGAEAARQILNSSGLYNVSVERVNGFLSDHYDPRQKVLRLSPQVYDTPSLAAVGVAAHEAGHALQDQQHYAPLQLRSAMVPSVQIGGAFRADWRLGWSTAFLCRVGSKYHRAGMGWLDSLWFNCAFCRSYIAGGV